MLKLLEFEPTFHVFQAALPTKVFKEFLTLKFIL